MTKTILKIKKKELLNYCNNASWYHTIRVFDEIKTSGVFDHEKYLSKYGLPESLKGKSVLDVGCSDGFFAFEFEKRGAQSVLAIDTNKFDGQTAISPSPSSEKLYKEKYKKAHLQNSKFIGLARKLGLNKVHHVLILKKLLNSNVEYRNLSIYDLDKLNKKYDLVFCGDLIEHLKNPIEAIEKLRNICGDTCIIALSNPLRLPKLFQWINATPGFRNKLLTYHGDSGGSFFHFHPETFRSLLLACGFKRVDTGPMFDMIYKKYKYKIPHIIYHCKV